MRPTIGRRWPGGAGRGSDRVAVGAEPAHQLESCANCVSSWPRNPASTSPNQVTKHDVSRGIPRRIAGTAARVAALLSPALLGARERVVASETFQFGKFGPGFAARAALEAHQPCAKLDRLPGAPVAHAGPGIVLFGHPWRGFRAALSSAAASPLKRNRARSRDRGVRRRSSRDPRTCPGSRDGRRGTFRCAWTTSRVSYMPSATDCACVQPRVVCSPSQADAGPWQLSQLTPSFSSNVLARCSGGDVEGMAGQAFGALPPTCRCRGCGRCVRRQAS